ncbi:MAG: magnesium transporter [Clostridiales bacterium]|jgi:magnesium transporter|nr:magnesium transporter [Clostridiales bacterium]MDY4655320.1 magnesium transporter [Eubacteriales bacterium]
MDKEVLLSLLEQKNIKELRPILAAMNPADIALFLSEVDEENLPLVFRLLPKDLAAETFVEMDSDLQELLISSFSDKELKIIIDELFLDDTVDIIEEMPANVVRRILNQSDPDTRKAINEILQYPEDSAGSLMTIEYVWLKKDMTVADAFARIRKTGVDKETIYTCYVTDENRFLIGLVTVKTLLLNDYETKIGDIMETNIIYIDTHTDKEEVANMFNKYDFLAMPVVDKERRLVGIITVDDAMDVMTDEATEDIAKIAAVSPTEKPYLKTSIWRLWLSRAPWLLVLMLSATFTGLIIKHYGTVAADVLLTACMPMLTGTGGNAGSQASATIIRGIALGEIAPSDIFRVIWKEVRVSVLLGLTLSVACFAKLMAVDQLYKMPNGFVYCAIICITLVITVMIAKVVGCILPMLAKKLRLDPAVVASPFISTIVDALSLLVYYNIAIALLTPLGVL